MLRPFLRTLALGLAVLCVADLAIAGWSAWRTIQVIRSWPAVEAEVVESRVFQARRPGPWLALLDRPVYGAECRVRYVIGDTVYTSPAAIPYRSASEAAMHAWAARCPVGSRRRIRCDPAAPGRVSLADRPDVLAFAGVLGVLPWAVGSALGSALAWLIGGRLRA